MAMCQHQPGQAVRPRLDKAEIRQNDINARHAVIGE